MKTKDDILLEQAYTKILLKENETEIEVQNVESLINQIIQAIKESPADGGTRDIVKGDMPGLSVIDEIDAWISDAGYHKIGRIEGWAGSLLNPTSDYEVELLDKLQTIADINFALDNAENNREKLNQIKAILIDANYLKENTMHDLSTISNPLKQSLLDSLEKYLKAGEHQDGEGFYSHYETAGDLAEDFARHLKTSVASKYEGVTDEMVKKAEEANKLRKRLSDQGLHGF